MRAESNSWAIGFVYMQLSGATDSSGAARYRIGTTTGAAILETARCEGSSSETLWRRTRELLEIAAAVLLVKPSRSFKCA